MDKIQLSLEYKITLKKTAKTDELSPKMYISIL